MELLLVDRLRRSLFHFLRRSLWLLLSYFLYLDARIEHAVVVETDTASAQLIQLESGMLHTVVGRWRIPCSSSSNSAL